MKLLRVRPPFPAHRLQAAHDLFSLCALGRPAVQHCAQRVGKDMIHLVRARVEGVDEGRVGQEAHDGCEG